MDYFDFHMVLSPDELAAADSTAGESSTATVSSQARTPVGTPAEHPHASDNVTVSVSTAFHPSAQLDHSFPDLILVSCDQVYFHIHNHRIVGASENGFAGLFPQVLHQDSPLDPIVLLTEPADVVNIVLHTIYDMSASQYAPSFATLSATLTALVKYGLPPKRFIHPSAPLFALLFSHTPLQPIESYALAASHDLEELAVAVSAHLLSFSLPALSDDLAMRIGPLYLKRLFFLHYGRMDALKRLLLHPPHAHANTPACATEQQRKLTRAWALASAHLVWDARPSLSTNLLQAALRPLEKELVCELCRTALHDRISELLVEWSAVKRTI